MEQQTIFRTMSRHQQEIRRKCIWRLFRFFLFLRRFWNQEILTSGSDKTETQGTIQNGDVSYDEPSSDDLTSGEGNQAPELPTPTPDPDGPTPTPDILDPSDINGISDGEAPFYMTLDYNTEPFTGTGTKEDPYVFLCSSAKGKITVMGSFFNKMAGYSRDRRPKAK